MERAKIHVENRELDTKHANKALRKQGLLPGVVYGKKMNMPIQVSKKAFNQIRHAQVIEMITPRGSYHAIIREIQKDPLTGELNHVDFLQVHTNEKLRTQIPIQVTGTSLDHEQGALVQLGQQSVEVEAFPQDLPDYLAIDISDLKIGDQLKARDLQNMIDLKIISDLNAVLVTILKPINREEPPDTDEEKG